MNGILGRWGNGVQAQVESRRWPFTRGRVGGRRRGWVIRGVWRWDAKKGVDAYPRKCLSMMYEVLPAADSEGRMRRVWRKREGLQSFSMGGGRQYFSITWKKLRSCRVLNEYHFEVSDHEFKIKHINIVCFTFFDTPKPARTHSYSRVTLKVMMRGWGWGLIP